MPVHKTCPTWGESQCGLQLVFSTKNYLFTNRWRDVTCPKCLENGHRLGVTKTRPKTNQPRPGEIALKSFVQDQMAKTGLSKGGILKRVHAGFYPKVKLRSVNQRVVFCRVNA